MRAKGEGSIYYDKPADRWRGQLDLGTDGRGKRRRVKVTGRTRAEVADKLQAKRTAIAAGDRAPATMTVGDLIDQWTAAVTPTMTPRTAEFARWTAGHAAEQLGGYRLAELRADHVDVALARLAADGLNRTSVARVRGTLSRVLRWGQRRDLVAKNVAEWAELPQAEPARTGRALTAVEVGRLLAAVKGSRLEALWLTMVGLGLRPAEALGVTWEAVDLDQGVLHVRQALKWHNGTPTLGGLKTGRSRRSLAMPAPVVDVLRRHRVQSLTERMALRWPDQWAELVFLSEAGTPLDASNMRRTFDQATRAAELGHVRLYDLRHTCASLMADAGVRLEDIADHLGHEGTDMARGVYVHRLTDTVDAAVDPLGKVIGGG